MAFERGKFGIEYNPKRMDNESSGLGWVFAVVGVVAFVSLCWTLVGRFRSGDDAGLVEPYESPPAESPSAKAAPDAVSGAEPATAEPPPPVEPQKRQFDDSVLEKRPVKVRNLLMRLEEAEKRHDVEMAVTTIEQIRAQPGSPAADIDDKLARRLGTLNMRRLFTLKNAQWVKQVTVKRGDVASRIAYENGSTLASLARLNGGNVEKVVIGKKLYVMDFPNFSLVIRRRNRTADLSLKGKFFKRYDILGDVSGKDGRYEYPANPKGFWRSLGVEFGMSDRAELELLLPAKASIIISEM